jgi:DNA-binding SARP family transcriptional activator
LLYGPARCDETAEREVTVMVYIRLLGVPAIEVDGQVSRAPRGRKAWAVLAYLLLADRAPSRRQLAEMLFADADDPLGAVRWTLGELRRCLGAALRLYGDPLRYTAAPDTCIDLHLLADENADPAA